MDITKQFDKACEAVERGNDEYAIQLLQDVLSIRPDHLESRLKLRETVSRKYMKSGVKSAGAATYLKGLVPLIKSQILGLTKKFDQAIIECEKFLVFDPNNKIVLLTLGKAAAALNYSKTAIWTFETLLEKNQNDTKILLLLGAAYESDDNVQKATECYERFVRLKPSERQIEQKLRDLAAQRTIQAGWDNVGGQKGDFKKVVKDASQMEDRSGEEEIIRTEDDLDRNIKRVLKDIETEPDNVKLFIQLGDLHRRGERYDEAREAYEKAKQIDPKNFAIDERLGDLKLREYDTQIEEIKDAIRKNRAEQGADEKLKALVAERNDFAREEYHKRIQIRPTDLPLRYKLGVLLYNAGDIDGALAEFQQAIKSPQHRRPATTYCGMCLLKKNMNDMAIQMFDDALQGSVTIDREETNILYHLGLAAEKLGDLKRAEEAYKKIFNTDMNYRDVKDKIEAIYSLRAKQESEQQQET